MFVKYESDDDLISANLKKEYKLIHNMCQHFITPRKGSKHKVSETDILTMYHLFHGLEINLPHIIIHHIIHAAKNSKSCVPYGMLLTLVFKKFHINLQKEKFDIVYLEFLPKNISHMKKNPSIGAPKNNIVPDQADTTAKPAEEENDKAPFEDLIDVWQVHQILSK